MHSGCSPKKRELEINATDDLQFSAKRLRTNEAESTPPPSANESRCLDDNANVEMPTANTMPHTSAAASAAVTTPSTRARCKQNSEQRLREIIISEFQQEINTKQDQLLQIDERITEAWQLLDRLRFAIVADYYKKQELKLAVNKTVDPQPGSTNILEKQNLTTHLPLHPSLKKIIGKRPRNLEELLGSCPKRAAAKNAKHTMHTKTAAELREERRKQRLIKETGLVIDHTKRGDEGVRVKEEHIAYDEMPSTSASSLRNLQRNLSERGNQVNAASIKQEEASENALNATRFNNKTKYLFVIGNTSKYIGARINKEDMGKQGHGTTAGMTHKWLVYVQMKDKTLPVENFIKKVRFFLHPSYRPNDIVDVAEAPFQIIRRGWGDFPMRLQFFFHEHFHQKPVQLIHKIVLDKTMSGRETLGSETIVEVWLRDKLNSVGKSPQKLPAKSPLSSTSPRSPTKKTRPHSNSLCHNMREAIDDNLIEFLNKIEESRTSLCADIEKIQPTVLVNEPLAGITANCSPIKRSPLDLLYRRQPLKSQGEVAISPSQNNFNLKVATPVSSSGKPAARNVTQEILNLAVPQSHIAADSLNIKCEVSKSPLGSPSTTTNSITTISNFQLNNSNNNNSFNSNNNNMNTNNNNKVNTSMESNLKVFNQSSGTVILPLSRPGNPAVLPKIEAKAVSPYKNVREPSNMMLQTSESPEIFQKKLVRLTDAKGKVKCVQMLVAAKNNAAGSSPRHEFSSAAGESPVVPSPNVSSQKLNKIMSIPGSQPTKNLVFQREGKIYLIDPMQSRLRQEQKNQVSLLKPQLRPKKEESNQRQLDEVREAVLRSVHGDHDYVPPPKEYQTPIEVPSNAETSEAAMKIALAETLRAMHVKRIDFQRLFQSVTFDSMRSAVEFILRKLPLAGRCVESCAGFGDAFPFTSETLEEFQALPAFKQRSHEWLRAKYISRILPFNSSLRELNAGNQQIHVFWSTHEVATFARYHAFTPSMKALLDKERHDSQATDDDDEAEQIEFAALVKNEVKSEQARLSYNTLSSSGPLAQWTEQVSQQLRQHDMRVLDSEIILIDDNDDHSSEPRQKQQRRRNDSKSPTRQAAESRASFYLPAPLHLQSAIDLVTDSCKDVGTRLQPEEIVPGVRFPAAQAVLATSLQFFVERILRESAALGLQDQLQTSQQHHQHHNHYPLHTTNSQLPQNLLKDLVIRPQHIRKVAMNNSDYDFLTNSHFAVDSHGAADTLAEVVKSEAVGDYMS